MAAAAPAKDRLRRQLERVLSTETLDTLPSATVPQAIAPPSRAVPRLRRLPPLNRD
jgi:hypothetical protein